MIILRISRQFHSYVDNGSAVAHLVNRGKKNFSLLHKGQKSFFWQAGLLSAGRWKALLKASGIPAG